MGREIRRVPPNWQHPVNERCSHWPICKHPCYKPLYSRDYETERKEWFDGLFQWLRGEHPDQQDPEDADHAPDKMDYWEWAGGPPEREHYVPYKQSEATWFQAYETVSEGTPVSPPFATEEELINYLVKHGDFWDQRRGHGGHSREAAEAFVKGGWAPSMVSGQDRRGAVGGAQLSVPGLQGAQSGHGPGRLGVPPLHRLRGQGLASSEQEQAPVVEAVKSWRFYG